MPGTIGSLGSVALLVSSITGPSLVVIPLLFQQAGWLTPLLTFAVIALLSGAAALLVVEAMSSIQGNEAFQASIEFTTIAHLFLGKRWHIVVQGLVYLAMQTLVIASLLESFQTMDEFLISVAHKTCAVSFSDGWVCVSQIQPNVSSAFSGHILGSFGTLITMSLILPLSLVHLVDNIIFQIASFIVLLIITVVWIVIFAVRGLNNNISVVGHSQSTVVGFVLSNFSFVTTIPAWVNNTHPSVDIRFVVWVSVVISCLIYIPIGWMGGSALVFPINATLLQVFATDTGHGALSTIARVSSYVFPLAVLITSVPVFTIVIRYNLLRGNVCSYRVAVFLSAIVPWLIAIPFQSNGGIVTILNWASLIFTSPSNLLVPFILFIVSKRHYASAVLDANVSPATAGASRAGSPMMAIAPQIQAPSATPLDNIPVVIITDSTDPSPDTTNEVKTLESSSTGGERPTLDPIPLSVMNRVSSPSKHRYYGQEVLSEAGGPPTDDDAGADRPASFLDTSDAAADQAHHHHPRRRPSRSLSLSPTLSRSITHASSSATGMDEFLLLSPSSASSGSHAVRSVLSLRTPRSSMSASRGSEAAEGLDVDGPGAPTLRGEGEGEVRISVSMLEAGDRGGGGGGGPAFEAFPRLGPTSVVRPTRISAYGLLVAGALVLTAVVYDVVEAVQGSSLG